MELYSDEGKSAVEAFLRVHSRWNIRPTARETDIYTKMQHAQMRFYLIAIFANDSRYVVSIKTPERMRIASLDGLHVANETIDLVQFRSLLRPTLLTIPPLQRNRFDFIRMPSDNDTACIVYDPAFIWNAPLYGLTFPGNAAATVGRFMFCYCRDAVHGTIYTIDPKTIFVTASAIAFKLPREVPVDAFVEVRFVVGLDDHLIASWTNMNTSFDSNGVQMSNQRVRMAKRRLTIAINATINDQIVRGLKRYISPVCETLVNGCDGGVIPLEYYVQVTAMLNRIVQYMYQRTDFDYVKLAAMPGDRHIIAFATPDMVAAPAYMQNYKLEIPMPIASLNSIAWRKFKKRMYDLTYALNDDKITADGVQELKRILDVYQSVYLEKDADSLRFMNDKLAMH